MYEMFRDCSSLETLDLSNLDTRKLTSMSDMFSGCSSLRSIDLTNFNTEKVTSMYSLFENCSSLTTLDLSSFNTSKVQGIYEMFCGCSSLVTIKVGAGWTTSSVYNNYNPYFVFRGCTNLVGGKGTVYNSRNVDKTYAHIDGGPDNPGYFTDASAPDPGDVNGDGFITIGDVTALIDLLLSNNTAGNEAADVNRDGKVSIADVTTLIDMLLSGNMI